MKKMIWLFIFLLPLTSMAQGLMGTWKYKSFIYDGQPYPPSNPAMDLRFQFTKDGISVLRWFTEGEDAFCERKALYFVESNSVLYQKNIWAHPGNHMSCASDPDMQTGRESRTPFTVEGNTLKLHLQLADKPYIYIFERIGDFNENDR